MSSTRLRRLTSTFNISGSEEAEWVLRMNDWHLVNVNWGGDTNKLNRRVMQKILPISGFMIALLNSIGLFVETHWGWAGRFSSKNKRKSFKVHSSSLGWWNILNNGSPLRYLRGANPGLFCSKKSKRIVVEILHRCVRHFVSQKEMKPRGKPHAEPDQIGVQ